MNSLLPLLIATIGNLSILTPSVARSMPLPRNTLICQYQNHSGSISTLTLQSVEKVIDLANPGGSEIQVSVNGTSPARTFSIATTSTRARYTVTYFKRDPVFVNDISITYTDDALKGVSLEGTWHTDSGALHLDCKFAASFFF